MRKLVHDDPGADGERDRPHPGEDRKRQRQEHEHGAGGKEPAEHARRRACIEAPQGNTRDDAEARRREPASKRLGARNAHVHEQGPVQLCAERARVAQAV